MLPKIKLAYPMTLALLGTLALGLSSSNAEPELPRGHPAVSMPEQPKASEQPNPGDVQSIEGIVDAYYASVSGPKGQARDWSRFLSLFMPDARFIVARMVDGKSVPMALSPDEFVRSNRAYFERGGYFEQDIHREIDTFGHIAQVFSTYASRRAQEDPEPYARGINSFQLIKTDGRWWITSIMWDHENPETNPIPSAYLPESDSETVHGDE